MNPMIFALMGLGAQELLIIALIALLIFGASRLPQLGRSIGQTVVGFREAVSGKEDTTEATPPRVSKVEQDSPNPPPRITPTNSAFDQKNV